MTLPPVQPPTTPPTVKIPQFERTFGSLTIVPNGSLDIRYKSLILNAIAKADGSWAINGAKTNKRSMLKSGSDFLFVTATGKTTLLEFDNGRNILFTAETVKPDNLREFVYSLRDDGKEIYAALFARPQGATENTVAQAVSLLQPKAAIIMFANDKWNDAAFQEALTNELFDGPSMMATPNQQIPF